MVLGGQEERHVDLHLLLAAHLVQDSRIHEVQLVPVHFLSVDVAIRYLVLDPMHGDVVEVVLEALLAVLPRRVAVEEQQLVKLLSIGAPDQLEIFAEVLLELAEDLPAPTVLLLLQEGLQQLVQQVIEVSDPRGSHGLGRLRDGVHDDSVALLEHEVDVLDCPQRRGLAGWRRRTGLKHAHCSIIKIRLIIESG